MADQVAGNVPGVGKEIPATIDDVRTPTKVVVTICTPPYTTQHEEREQEERNTLATRQLLHDANIGQGEENFAMDAQELDDLTAAAEGGGISASYKNA